MSEMYALKESTLTALGDAVRSKVVGGDVLLIDNVELGGSVLFKSYQLAGANIKVKLDITYANTNGNQLCIVPGTYNDYATAKNATGRININQLGNTGTGCIYENTFKNNNGITIFTYYSATYGLTPANINVELIGLDENGNEYKYTPLEMVDVINGLEIPHIEPIVLTGSQMYRCAGSLSSTYVELFSNSITTNDITNTQSMFYYYTGKSIPFEINMKKDASAPMQETFYECSNLRELPKINNAKPNMMGHMFYGCKELRNIPENYFDDWDFSAMQTVSSASRYYMFYSCYSLRNIPQKLLNALWGAGTSSSYVACNNGMYQCYSLDEIKGMGVHTASLSTNRFTMCCDYCSRLKDFTFAVNEDGTPKTANWKSQTFDLSNYVGYASSSSNITAFNSGITADKQVTDDATYQALKNDPDWFTSNINYSRYNHDSAVNTINSLPDTSAYGTNTIKFKGAAGALTDGGAINTLTAEEIAVATAKGWTVTLV